MNKAVILGLSCIALTTGCSQKKSSGSGVSRYNSVSIHPIRIETQVKSCSRVQSQSINRSFGLDLFLEGVYINRDYDFIGLLDNRKLRSTSRNKVINDTNYNYEQIAHYSMIYDDYEGQWNKGDLFDGRVISQEKDVEICPGVTMYKTKTVENAALSANYVITRTNTQVKDLFPDLKIKPITVKVAPLYGEKLHYNTSSKKATITQYFTDNAFYMASNNTIQFLPQSKEGLEKGVFGKIPLWEIPMVASHEYGHHLFATLYPKSVSDEETSVKDVDFCFDNRVEASKRTTGPAALRDTGYKTVIGAFNEGFADLISFYSLEDDERTLTDITCMEMSRDVDSSTFFDGTSKIFTKHALDLFFDYEEKDTTKTCGDPDFQDIHDIGAIFAHAADSILNIYTNDKAAKLKVTINWLKSVNDKHDSISGMYKEDQLHALFALFSKQVLEEFGTLNQTEVCKTTKNFDEELDSYVTRKFLPECL